VTFIRLHITKVLTSHTLRQKSLHLRHPSETARTQMDDAIPNYQRSPTVIGTNVRLLPLANIS
jgi:hypothetical protein